MAKITKNDFFVAYKVPCVKPKLQGRQRSLTYELYQLHRLILKETSPADKKLLGEIAATIHKDRYQKASCFMEVFQAIGNFFLGRGFTINVLIHANIQKNCRNLIVPISARTPSSITPSSKKSLSSSSSSSSHTTQNDLDFNSKELDLEEFKKKIIRFIRPLDSNEIQNLANAKDGPFEIFQHMAAFSDEDVLKIEFVFQKLENQQVAALLRGFFEGKFPSLWVFINCLTGINSLKNDSSTHTARIINLTKDADTLGDYLRLGKYRDGIVDSKQTKAMFAFLIKFVKCASFEGNELLDHLKALWNAEPDLLLAALTEFDILSIGKKERDFFLDWCRKNAAPLCELISPNFEEMNLGRAQALFLLKKNDPTKLAKIFSYLHEISSQRHPHEIPFEKNFGWAMGQMNGDEITKLTESGFFKMNEECSWRKLDLIYKNLSVDHVRIFEQSIFRVSNDYTTFENCINGRFSNKLVNDVDDLVKSFSIKDLEVNFSLLKLRTMRQSARNKLLRLFTKYATENKNSQLLDILEKHFPANLNTL